MTSNQAEKAATALTDCHSAESDVGLAEDYLGKTWEHLNSAKHSIGMTAIKREIISLQADIQNNRKKTKALFAKLEKLTLARSKDLEDVMDRDRAKEGGN